MDRVLPLLALAAFVSAGAAFVARPWASPGGYAGNLGWPQAFALVALGAASVPAATQSLRRSLHDDPAQPGDEDADQHRHHPHQRTDGHHVAITDGQSSDECEIDCIAYRPTLDKADADAQGELHADEHGEDGPYDSQIAHECDHNAPLQMGPPRPIVMHAARQERRCAP